MPSSFASFPSVEYAEGLQLLPYPGLVAEQLVLQAVDLRSIRIEPNAEEARLEACLVAHIAVLTVLCFAGYRAPEYTKAAPTPSVQCGGQ
jgi:hypothetical protein